MIYQGSVNQEDNEVAQDMEEEKVTSETEAADNGNLTGNGSDEVIIGINEGADFEGNINGVSLKETSNMEGVNEDEFLPATVFDFDRVLVDHVGTEENQFNVNKRKKKQGVVLNLVQTRGEYSSSNEKSKVVKKTKGEGPFESVECGDFGPNPLVDNSGFTGLRNMGSTSTDNSKEVQVDKSGVTVRPRHMEGNGEESRSTSGTEKEVDATVRMGDALGADLANHSALILEAIQGWVRKLRKQFGVDFLGVQETKVSGVVLQDLVPLWGDGGLEFDAVDAVGLSGGLVTMWNPKVFRKTSVTKHRNFVAVSGVLVGDGTMVTLINIYAPQRSGAKRVLWAELARLLRGGSGMFVLMGDFNVVRNPEERRNSYFNRMEAEDFNGFIDELGLCEYFMREKEVPAVQRRRRCLAGLVEDGASVEYRQEELSSAEMEKENCDDLSLFADFNGLDFNLDLLQQSNRLHVALDSAPVSPLKPEIKSIIHGQDSGADDLLISLNNITDYHWLLSPPRHPLPSPEVEEQITLNDHTLIPNGLSTSPESKLENPTVDGTSTNGVKPSSTIRRPSPSRKTPSTGSRHATPTTRPTLTKPSRSSTPTSRATVTATTKPLAPVKRSTTPTSRPPVLAALSKSTSRSSTPIQPLSVTAKSASRSSTPIKHPSITAPAKSASISSTPVQLPSVTASAKSASRSSTPTQRPSVTPAKSASRSSTPTQRPSVTAPAKSASRSSTPIQRSSVTVSAKSASRSSTPTQRPSVTASAKSASRSSTPTLRSSNGGVKSGMTRGRGHSNGDDDVNPVLMGTQMVERVVNMRKLAPPRQDNMSDQDNASGKLSVSQDNSGFGRSLSKKSFDMALRHLDIRRSMPGNMRASITKIPASSVYSVRSESTKIRTMSASDSPLATSSSASSDHSEPGHSYH
ncbi:hypothetical protein M8C21_019782 [Ambrosia artemisiifolia]|uniref:Endonuclease/exonuclease/phosphatase domain-containing protein n=1 Tax=Ambrosia artemisiifolia TaxID=4212 RepID=A0AAD5D7Z5_AMBAR|nr:hypothetical protein M8C21_019782 [Ambrosia artemisiifolia]